MRAITLLIVFLLLSLLPLPVKGDEFEVGRILLPVHIFHFRPLPGMHSSLWITELWIHNAAENQVQFAFDCRVVCGDRFLQPGETVHQPPIFHGVLSPPTAFVLFDKRYADEIQVSLRVQDISRQALTWGTEIPVIREKDLRTGRVDLLDVPIDERFRSNLRIYTMTDGVALPVTVSFFPMTARGNEPPLAEVELTLAPGSIAVPGYAEILSFDNTMAELQGHERVMIRITAEEPIPFWAFVSVNNNLTQHVTTITPR